MPDLDALDGFEEYVTSQAEWDEYVSSLFQLVEQEWLDWKAGR